MVCIRCQKRPAIIFIQRMDNGQMKQEGYCLHCARELHIKPVDDLMKQFGMSDQDLDNMENRMESMMEEMGDANPLSMMMNMANGGEHQGGFGDLMLPSCLGQRTHGTAHHLFLRPSGLIHQSGRGIRGIGPFEQFGG